MRLRETLPRRAVDDECSGAAALFALPNETAVETQLVRRKHPAAKDRRLSVNGNAAGANPILRLAT